jgi:hypothetical protein
LELNAMKKYLFPMMLPLLILVVLTGCAGPRYHIQVNGYTDPEAKAAPAPGATIFVIENKEAKNPLLEKEIKGKINKLLDKQGFRLASYEAAQYYLLFSYGMGSERKVTVAMPEFITGWAVGVTYPPPGSYVYMSPWFWPSPVLETQYDRWLMVNVVDGQHYREKGQFRTLWVGEARSVGSSADLRVVVNYLLVAALSELGKNTGKAVEVDIPPDDPRVRDLTP